MITNVLIEFLIQKLYDLPVLTFTGSLSYLSVVFDVLEVVCYLIPVYAFVPLITISVQIVMFKIGCNVVRWVWDMLPIA